MIKKCFIIIILNILILNCAIDGLPCDTDNELYIKYQDICKDEIEWFVYNEMIKSNPRFSDDEKTNRLNTILVICLLAIEERKKEEENKKNLCGIGKRWPKL
ncbi:MAG: hypothetical protein KatS3mg129_2322 [Leptospiraceae bacterium]|nr:MAG: hypothetical protein KatS3mg129_0166 [Leptospiraceae bacterium]GIX42589.1 MAG: hypothetical protein KatS3mg129_2322 [Leptospiraceae bacterium]